MGSGSSIINPLFNDSVRNEKMTLLMDKLNGLYEKNKPRKEPNMGESYCSHMHVECWNGVFVCSGCYQAVSDPDRIHSEHAIMKQLGETDPSLPEDSAQRGVTIAFLVAICLSFNLYEVSTGEILRNYIVPLTSGSRCRFVELKAMQESDVVGEANTFISHCFKAPFGSLVAALCDGGADLTRRVWVDIFAVRQWPSSKHDLHFEVVIKQCPSFMVVCPSLQEVSEMSETDVLSRRFPAVVKAKVPFFRIWCLYELYYAAIEGKPIVMKGGCCRLEGPEGQQVMCFVADQDMLGNMYFAIDVNDAEATVPSDKAMIFEKILSYEEGVAGFNSKVRGVLVGAGAACEYPDLLCAVCGDAAAMAVVRGQPEKYFIIAAAGGFQAVLEDLLLQNPNLIHTVDEYGRTAIMLAAQGGHLTSMQLLIDRGAEVNTTDYDGDTAILGAAQGGHLTCVQLLVDRGMEVNETNKSGWTSAIVGAAIGGHLTCLQLLLDTGADVNAANKNGMTAIMAAAMGGHLTCLQLLVDRGAEVNAADQDGAKAIMLAAARGCLSCLQLLVDNGAEVNAVNQSGLSAYRYAAKKGHQDCMDYLISKGAAVR